MMGPTQLGPVNQGIDHAMRGPPRSAGIPACKFLVRQAFKEKGGQAGMPALRLTHNDFKISLAPKWIMR